MADISDVEQALAASVVSTLYPDGPSAASIVGALCRVYRGWPNAATLNTDLSTGVVNVTVVTDNDTGCTTTRYLPEWGQATTQPGVTANASAPSFTISGSPALGDVVGALVDGVAFVYRVQAGDAPELIAANLNQLIQSGRTASVQGTTVVVPGASSIVVRVVCDSPTSFESRRQEKDVRIICWCPNPAIRDLVASLIDTGINEMSFLSLADTTAARVFYKDTSSYDQSQNALLYRRDLIYTIEYPTVLTTQSPSMLFGNADVNGNANYG